MMLSLASWCVFFFFKQKTAYEMRISDWSSDVCSSDLLVGALAGQDDLVAAVPDEARQQEQGRRCRAQHRPLGMPDDIGEDRRHVAVADAQTGVAGIQGLGGGVLVHGLVERAVLEADRKGVERHPQAPAGDGGDDSGIEGAAEDRKSTRLNSSH